MFQYSFTMVNDIRRYTKGTLDTVFCEIVDLRKTFPNLYNHQTFLSLNLTRLNTFFVFFLNIIYSKISVLILFNGQFEDKNLQGH